MKNINKVSCGAENEIREVLRKFQEGYTKRDKSIIDSYMDELFVNEGDTLVLGTGIGELCLGFEGAREIVESDWEYWGDVAVDTENPEITVKGDTAWLAAKGTIKYEFEHSKERCDRYLNAVKGYFEEESPENKLNTRSKLAYINSMLTYTFYNRPLGKRVYYWPLRVTAVLIRQENKWKFKYMQFSLPTSAEYPDVRFGETGEHQKEHYAGVTMEAQFAAENLCPEGEDIRLAVDSFINSTMNSDKSSQELIDKYFSIEDNISIIGTGEEWYNGRAAAAAALDQQRQQWRELELDASHVGAKGDVAWFTALGRARQQMDEKQAEERTAQAIKEILAMDIASEDKLFRIQKGIALMLKGISEGSSYEWPMRLEAIFIKEADKWVIHSLQNSYPFYYILEGKYDLPPYIIE